MTILKKAMTQTWRCVEGNPCCWTQLWQVQGLSCPPEWGRVQSGEHPMFATPIATAHCRQIGWKENMHIWGKTGQFSSENQLWTDVILQIFSADTAVDQRQIFSCVLTLAQPDLKNKFRSRAVLFFSFSAAEVLWFVLTLKIQNKICANDIPISQLVLATLLPLCRTSASTNASTRTLLRAECPTFQPNHSNYKTCNKTVSALNE